jgi:predicted acylesterase/phospholipase RssA
MSTRRVAAVGLVAVAALTASQTSCSTTTLVNKFNTGFLDSNGDPCHDPEQRSQGMVRELVTHELMDGFFTQGSSTGPVALWAIKASTEPEAFVGYVIASAKALGSDLPWSPVPARPEFEAFTAPSSPARDRVAALGKHWRGPPTEAPGAAICEADGKLLPAAAELSDALRFNAALERAAADVTAIAIEGLVNEAEVRDGAREAFAETAQYLARRTWQRHFDRHVNGVVIKGGASTGLFSAGVVWVALNLIMNCMADNAPDGCHAAVPDPRFALVSGTSTGAMISVATELFNNAKTDAERRTALDRLAGWFTCVGDNDLYCVQKNDALAMLGTQRGLLQFDGLEQLLDRNVTGDMFRNQSELVLNTVNFRTGTLLDLSDLDELKTPSDVVQAALASAVLPFIGEPVPHLPVDYNPRYQQTYLDGGIRSELPILPLVRRGAERVLIVSSDASVTGESNQLSNGLDIATRFIDVAIGGVTESEVQHAERHVESVRLAEIDACKSSSDTIRACQGSKSPDACVTAFCQGDWAAVCAVQPPPPEKKPMKSTFDLTDQRIASLWGTRSFFRNESEVQGLHAYDFDSTSERRLFLAGAEAGRVRCAEIARLLDFPLDKIGAKTLTKWCTPDLEEAGLLCSTLGLTSSKGLRSCSAPPPSPAGAAGCR